ncbi:MAG: tetratricopeptide repeat protein [Bacteroidota bacterium]|jgi:tetratricopeptide (TPR) repeat protein
MSEFEGDGLSNEDFENSLKRFEEMVSSNETQFFDADELEEIIDYYLQWFNIDMAKKAIDYATKQYPYNSSIKIKKAQYLSSQHHTRDALALLNEVEAVESSNSELYMTRGYIYSQIGLSKQAIENFKTALNLSEHKDEVYVAIGIEFLNDEKAEDALYYFKKAIKLNPENEVALNEISLCFELTTKSEEAISFYENYIDENPYSYYAWFNLGISYNRISLFEKAVEAYDYAIAIKDNFSSAYFNKANSLAQQDKYVEAIEVYKETFKYEEPDANTYYYIGECYENLSQYDDALVNYNRAIKLDPAHADAWLGIGIVLDYQNRITESIHYIKKAIEINPHMAEYWYVFAEVQHKLGFLEEAAAAYIRVIELGYDEFDVYIDYAKLLYDGEYYKDCEKILAEGIEKFPNTPELIYRMSGLQMELGRKQDGMIFLKNALQLDYDKHSELLEYLPILEKDNAVMQLILSYKK